MSYFSSIISDSRRHSFASVNRISSVPAKSITTYLTGTSAASDKVKTAPLVNVEQSEVESRQQPSKKLTEALLKVDSSPNLPKAESKNNYPLTTGKNKRAERQSVVDKQFDTQSDARVEDIASTPTPTPTSTTSFQVSEKLDHDLSAVSQQAAQPITALDQHPANQDISHAQSERVQNIPEISAQDFENTKPAMESSSATTEMTPINNQTQKQESVSAEYLLQKAITNLRPILPSAENSQATAGQNRPSNVGSSSNAPQVKIGQMNVIVEGPVVTRPIADKSAVDNSSRSFLRGL